MWALTVRQPWAALIVAGVKDVENRSWRAPERIIGARVYIHASDRRADDVADVPVVAGVDQRGVIVGSVVVVGCVADAASDWARPDCWHWLLADAAVLDPITCRGHHGIWELPYGPARAVRLQTESGRLGQ